MPGLIDRKFNFIAINPINRHVYTQDNGVVFVAKDKALPATLKFYREECKRLGSNPEHLESIDLLIKRVEEFQANNEVKVPDTHLPGEINRCIHNKES